MSHQESWANAAPEQSLQYPYAPHDICPKIVDDYNRTMSQLVASFVTLGKRVLRGESLSQSGEDKDNDIGKDNIRMFLRICEDSLMPQDLNFLTRNDLASQSKTSIILGPDWVQNLESYSKDSLQEFRLFQQLVLLHHVSQNKWSIFLVSLGTGSIEGYLVGDYEVVEIRPVVLSLLSVLEKAFPTTTFTFRQRLQIPSNYGADPILMSFLIAIYLHKHGQYLDLNGEKILLHKVALLKDFQRFHDNWLGHFTLEKITASSHPFITTEYMGKDNLEELENMGWACIDVVGDGNCGFYSLILGLENNGNFGFSATKPFKNASNMRDHIPWQAKIHSLRKKLQAHSKKLLEKCYHLGEEPDWWWRLNALNEEEREQLTEGFVCKKLRRSEYFTGRFLEMTDYHMNPYWSIVVFASYFKMNATLIMRTSSVNTKKVRSYSWSTTTCEHNPKVDSLHQDHVIVKQESHLYRPPDSKFKEKATIEILYLTGYKDIAVEDTQHFLFLRRVLCDKITKRSNPIRHSLREVLERPLKDHHGSDVNEELAIGENTAPPSHPTPGSDEPPSNSIQVSLRAVQESESENQPVNAMNHERDNHSEIDHTTRPSHPMHPSDEPPSKSDIHHRAILGDIAAQEKPRSKRKQTSNQASEAKVTKRKKMNELTKYFDELYLKGTFKTPLRMKYDSAREVYFTRYYDFEEERFTNAIEHDNVDNMDRNLVKAAMDHPNNWVGCSVGDAGDGEAPEHLATNIPTIYQQHDNRFCLTYSLASALFYCGFVNAASILASQAKVFSLLHFDDALSKLKELMLNLVPEIGRPTVYGVRTKKAGKRRQLSWETLFVELVPHPTVIIPTLPDGTMSHAFCVVDDLIFDSITPKALKLKMESVQWIFNGSEVKIFQAIRFNMKSSPSGTKVKTRYRRPVTLNWYHPGRVPVQKTSSTWIESHYTIEATSPASLSELTKDMRNFPLE